MITTEFHIHIDAVSLEQSFELALMNDLGFSLKNFLKEPTVTQSYAPDRHLTYKTQDRRESNHTFKAIKSYLDRYPNGMEGYIEYECIPERILISNSEFNTEVAIPFKLEFGSLPEGKFREDEIHITLDRDRSDHRLRDSLKQMGFSPAYMKKDYGIAEILTIQGSRKDIEIVLPLITNYLKQVGGAVNCVIKEERIVRSWMSAPDITLPPVITSIQQLAVAQPTHQLCVR